jgi:hypothetical protein
VSTDIKWQKSSFSGGAEGNNCLELSASPAGPALRESDDPATVLTTTPSRLAALLDTVKDAHGFIAP